MAEHQKIPARHGVATFVPAGQVIKIINSSGTQVIDTWAFALPKPDGKKGEQKKEEAPQQKGGADEEKKDPPKAKAPPKKGKKGGDVDLPSQEDAEKAVSQGMPKGEAAQKAEKSSGWSSYVPSIPTWSSSSTSAAKKPETQQQKDSKTWSSYFPSGQGFSSYIPKTATDTVSSFASSHNRDTTKSYVEQLQDFSKTPVGAAGVKGIAAMSGSGYGGSLYAGYQAYNAMNAPDAPPMEFMSMAHTRAATLHVRPKANDVLVSNLREPILTMVEDSSPGIHDTLIAACDPQRYRGLGVDKWEEHGSCAENLVLALKELNERAGLKGAKAIGADVTINSVPAPLNLFMNVPWDDDGDLGFKAPKGKQGDYVRLKAERDVVVIMSACPQDVLEINNRKPTDASFVVEEDEASQKEALERASAQSQKRRPPPRKLNSSRAPSTVATGDLGDDDKSRVGSTPAKKPPPRRAPAKKPVPPSAASSTPTKKPAPPSAAPAQKKPIPTRPAPPQKQDSDATTVVNGAPAEKKKPRKLTPKPKPEE